MTTSTASVATQSINIELNESIVWGKGETMYYGVITEVREKAIKVDIAVEGVWIKSHVTVYNYSCWVPISAIIDDRGVLTIKKWLINKGVELIKIKKYHLSNGVRYYI